MSIIFLALAIGIGLGFWYSPKLKLAYSHAEAAAPAPIAIPAKPGKVVEWTGAALGLLGSALLANNNEYSGYGFIAFLLSNACWLWFGLRTRTWGMVTMQLGFTGTSLLGIYRWLL